VMELAVMHDDAAAQSQAARQQLATLREQLSQWSSNVERALEALAAEATEIADMRPTRSIPAPDFRN